MSIFFSRLIKQDGPINEKYDPIYEKYYMESPGARGLLKKKLKKNIG